MMKIEVGQRWPYAMGGEGLQAVIEPTPEGLSVMLVASMAGPTHQEVRAMKKSPVRLGIVPAAPLVWIVLDGGGVSMDAPYAPALAGIDHYAALQIAPRPAVRSLVTIPLVDHATCLVRAIRVVSVSAPWMNALADGIAAAGAVDTAGRDRAMRAGYARWKTTRDMLSDAVAVETGGKA